MIPYYLSAGIPGNSTLSDKVLLLWHIIGLVAIITIFTFVRSIPYENVRYEICRLATFYYIPLTLMAGLYLILRIYTRAYQFVLRHTDQRPCPRGWKLSWWIKSSSRSSSR